MHQKLVQVAGIALLTAMACALTSCGATPATSEPEGIFRTKTIATPFYLSMHVEQDFFRYHEYVESHRMKGEDFPHYSSLDIAYDIYMVSQEFGLDPRVLLALVRKESAFRVDAESPTHAVGLTQFTGAGILEVKDQLGARGPTHALRTTTDYWTRLVPRVYGYLSGGKNFSIPAADVPTSTIKKMLINDPLLAIIYGAILLKTHVASSSEKMGSPGPEMMPEIYREALENYNGDPPAKEEYAQTIMRWAVGLSL